MKKQFDTLEAIAAATAAIDRNENQILRDSFFDQTKQIEVRSNRSLVESFLLGDSVLTVSDEHRQRAQGIIEYLQQVSMLKTLTSTSPDNFLNTINDLLVKPTILQKEIGLLVWAPKLYADYQKKDAIKEISSKFEYSSRFFGKIGDTVTTNFTLIESRYVKSVGCFAVYGYTKDDNLVFYWASDEKKIIKSGTIKARIKAHNRDSRRGNAFVTTLNYVKSI